MSEYVRYRIWNRTRDSVGDSVQLRFWLSGGRRSRVRVWDRLWWRIRDMTWEHVWDRVDDRVRGLP